MPQFPDQVDPKYKAVLEQPEYADIEIVRAPEGFTRKPAEQPADKGFGREGVGKQWKPIGRRG